MKNRKIIGYDITFNSAELRIEDSTYKFINLDKDQARQFILILKEFIGY